MPFKPGNKLGPGRKVGSKNKKTFDAVALCERLGYDPLEALWEVANTTRDEAIKVACHKEAAKYVYTQKRATEVSGPSGGPIQTEVETSNELKELLADLSKLIDTKVNERGSG